jgi:hypothetical protein
MARLRRGISSGGRCSCRRGATRPRAFLTPTPTPTVAHEPKNDETPGLLMAVRVACRNLVATLDGHASDAGARTGRAVTGFALQILSFGAGACRCLPEGFRLDKAEVAGSSPASPITSTHCGLRAVGHHRVAASLGTSRAHPISARGWRSRPARRLLRGTRDGDQFCRGPRSEYLTRSPSLKEAS